MDEVFVYNRTLSPTEITDLFNLDYLGDVIAPNITFIYPVNDTYYSNFNGSIILNMTEPGSCDLNDTDFPAVSDNTTIFNFAANLSLIPDGFYSIFANCSDAFNNENTAEINFTIDRENPYIYDFNPEEHENTLNISAFFNDSILFYHYNYTFGGSCDNGDIKYQSAYYNSTLLRDFGSLNDNTTYYLNITFFDYAGNFNYSCYALYTEASAATVSMSELIEYFEVADAMLNALIIGVIIYIIMLAASMYFQSYAMGFFSAAYGLIFSVYMYNNYDSLKLVIAVFFCFNAYLFWALMSYKNS
jgi:hypothetical protein